MTTHTIRLKSIHDVKSFVAACTGCEFEIFLGTAPNEINAKSIMGLFSLDFNSPILMTTTGEGAALEAFLAEIAVYLTEE
ncbi:MAG: HPr family phosphocarrier protein [Clostridia bacterium]|nr:HPr family phosphocarrier protein [Clostridia bacterium]MBQ3076385.1 HPr family phosphocarrier protein [Clostridia bacterium]